VNGPLLSVYKLLKRGEVEGLEKRRMVDEREQEKEGR
jgi:hypothetical protein